jgi:hypothetical protein
MSARNDLDCLLEKGLISQELYDALAPIVGITGDLSFALSIVMGGELAGSLGGNLGGNPLTLVAENVVAGANTSMSGIPADITKAVVTVYGDDVMFTVHPGGNAASGSAHILKKEINYTFTPAEITNATFSSLSAPAFLNVTYYN